MAGEEKQRLRHDDDVLLLLHLSRMLLLHMRSRLRQRDEAVVPFFAAEDAAEAITPVIEGQMATQIIIAVTAVFAQVSPAKVAIDAPPLTVRSSHG